MKTLESSAAGRSFGGLVVTVLLLVVVIGGAIYYYYPRSPSLQNAFRSVKGSSQDATTTSKVRTALLLSKHVSAFDIKVETSQGEVTLTGQVPSEETKSVAGAIAQDTSGATRVHNELTVNPAAERGRHGLDLSPFLRQTVKTQNSANGMKMPLKGGLSHGFVSTAVHEGVQVGGDSAAGDGGVARGGGTSV